MKIVIVKKKKECKLENKCNYCNIVYEAEIVSEETYEDNKYIGLMSGKIKERIAKHYYDAKTVNMKTATKLTERIWQYKEEGVNYNVRWKVVARATSRKPSQKQCNLCMKENILIMEKSKSNTHMNSRDKMGDVCLHRR